MSFQERSSAADIDTLRIHDDQRAARPRRGRRYLAAALSLASLGAVAALLWPRSAARPEVTTARAAAAQDSDGALLNASGYVTPRRRATVAAKITGRLQEIYAEEGKPVRAGQVLAKLDDSEARARLVSAHAERGTKAAVVAEMDVRLANAERDLRRNEELSREGIISVQALDATRTEAESLRAGAVVAREDLKAAEARVGVALQDLANYRIVAPFTGLVVSKDAQIGEMVSPVSAGGGFTRTGIATVVDMASLEIEVDVSEAHIARLRPGQPATAVLNAYPEWRIPAKVRTVIPTADRQKATVKVRLAFDALDPRILPDMGVKVTFLGDPASASKGTSAAVLIPRAALHEDHEATLVYVLRDGRIERRAVRVGRPRGDQQEVVAGLAPGDEVVTGVPPLPVQGGGSAGEREERARW